MVELRAGDVIAQGNYHILMWAGEPKPIVHNVDKGQFSGVIRQSLKGAISSHMQPEQYFQRYPVRAYEIYRCEDMDLSMRAAEFAVNWATESRSEEAREALFRRKGKLKVPYGHMRLVHAENYATSDDRQWSVQALFRALKAYARHETILAPRKGSTCSQFMTYCYQAASIERHFGDLNFSEETLEQLRGSGKYGHYVALANTQGDPNAIDLIEQLEVGVQILSERLHPALLTHAKMVYVETILDRMKAPGSGFSRVGFLAPSLDDMATAEIFPLEEEVRLSVATNYAEEWEIAHEFLGMN